MKSERRHELKENDLAHAIGTAKEYLDERGKQLTIGVIIFGAVIAAVVFGARSRTAAMEDIWQRRALLKFDQYEVGRESLESLVSMTKGISNERFLRSSLRLQGQQGLRLSQLAPAAPDRDLTLVAKTALEELLTRFGKNPLDRGVALSGLATVEENLYIVDRDPAHKEQAKGRLNAIVNDDALSGMPLMRIAMDRLRDLDKTFSRVEFSYPEPDLPEAAEDAAITSEPTTAPASDEKDGSGGAP